MCATAIAQPNIALVKYWGKSDVARNLPAVGSLSITLDSLWTTMSVEFSPALDADTLVVNEEAKPAWLPRVTACIDRVVGEDRQRARVVSECNFPAGAGLASSASAFAALAVAAAAAGEVSLPTLELARIAGGASGSAARSLYGGFVELSVGADDIELTPLAAPDDWPLAVVAAVTSEVPKAVSSTQAMLRSAETSPFFGRWVEEQHADLEAAREAVAQRDFSRLAEVSEHNCLKMHSVTWTSRPAVTYWNPATLTCMQAVRELRAGGEAVFFTIDAGPQVKAVCLPASAPAVADRLAALPGVLRVMTSPLGGGARLRP